MMMIMMMIIIMMMRQDETRPERDEKVEIEMIKSRIGPA